MGYYGSGGSSGSGGGGGGSGSLTFDPAPLTGGGGGGGQIKVDDSGGDIGKGAIDLTDPLGSIGETVGNVGDFAGTVIGGVAGAIGSLGPDGETASLGQLAEDIGRIPGGVGDFRLPYLGNDPNRQQATLSQVPGAMFEPFYQAQQGVRRGIGQARALDYQKGVGGKGLPEDLQARLDAGASAEVIAEELLARGEDISSNPVGQFLGEAILDPLNLIAPGVGKALQGAKAAGAAVRTTDELTKLGLGQQSVGRIYNIATAGFDRAGAATIERVIGPTTSGVFHALGTKPYQSLVRGAAKLDRAYGLSFERAFDLGAGQLPRAVIAREIANDISSRLARRVADGEALVRDRLFTKMRVANKELERRAEELLMRVTPAFSKIDDAVRDSTIAKYAAITGMSPEDAARVIGRVDRGTARTTHLAYYGHAGGQLAELKKVIPSTKKLDVERLTVIAPDTLTDELAEAIKLGDIPIDDAVDQFSVLGNHFLGKQYGSEDVLKFIDDIGDSLPQAVKLPKTGKNALPKELGDWRARNSEFGYELGFAPKGGWKVKVDADGNIVASDPFVHFVSDVESTTMRNPLGRFLDGLMRGTTQTVIVQQARERMVNLVAKLDVPISPNQVRSIERAIRDEAAGRKLAPRALVGEHIEGQRAFEHIFRKFLSPDEYTALIAKYDPAYIVMKAYEGNWDTVGLTQKFTGSIKSTVQVGSHRGPGGLIAQISERLYPLARFTARPTFQAQEVIESPFFNALRGVTDRPISDEIASVYRALAEQPEFKWLTEANFLNIAGERAVAGAMREGVGPAMGRFANIQARKNTRMIQQVMFEHGEAFRDAVRKVNPKFWKAMEEAYDTTDPRLIADRFMAERLALGASENIDDAMKLVDEATATLKSTLDDAVIRPGQEAASQAANVKVGVANGGTVASGGAMKAEGALPSSASEMVLQAFKDSFRDRSNVAFQTHFFNPQRGWLERSLNHPYLGLYPLSYMWGKVLPEFARFLLKRPFGVEAPGLAINHLERVQQAYLGALAEDPEFSKWIEDHEESIYFANLLVPGNPLNLTVNAPAWARHTAEDVRAGKKVDQKTVTREIQDSTNYAFGPAHDLSQVSKVGTDLFSIGEDIFANLDKAAREYDGQFPLAPRR